LVDDRRTILALSRVFLSSLDLEISTASDGAEALVQARQAPPDIIVADVQMPNMDGLELCAEVKLDPALRHIRCILLSSTADDPGLRERAQMLGVVEVLKKPVTPDALRGAVLYASRLG
jgi:CheY-like chemotaxis protein